MMLAEGDRALLVGLAREAIRTAVMGAPAPVPPAADVCQLAAGAFVTLTLRGALRGCIGQWDPDDPIGELIVHCAAAAALDDPRFRPVSPGELESLSVEISVLTRPESVTSIDEIDVGRHGLIVEQGRHRGLLLPQVATEHGWSREEFLSHTCRKAGLPVDAWRRGAQIFCFEAEIFGDPRRHE
jgi:AmmeMemoRadiSam system protein A